MNRKSPSSSSPLHFYLFQLYMQLCCNTVALKIHFVFLIFFCVLQWIFIYLFIWFFIFINSQSLAMALRSLVGPRGVRLPGWETLLDTHWVWRRICGILVVIKLHLFAVKETVTWLDCEPHFTPPWSKLEEVCCFSSLPPPDFCCASCVFYHLLVLSVALHLPHKHNLLLECWRY